MRAPLTTLRGAGLTPGAASAAPAPLLRRLAVLVALGCLAALAAAPAARAAGSDPGFGVRLLPARPAASPQSYFTPTVRPGHAYTGHVTVDNHARKTLRFDVSAVDGLTGQTSGSVYANRQDPVTRSGRWLKSAIRHLSIVPGRSATIDFTVRVPAGTQPGQYLSGLAIEDTTPKAVAQSGGVHVKEILRSVVGVLVKVPGPSHFQPTLSSLKLEELQGPHVGSVQVGLGNSGRHLAKPRLKIALRGPDGYRRTLTRHLDTVLGADAITYPDAWPDNLAKGRYDVTATLSGRGRSVTKHAVVQLGSNLRGTESVAPIPGSKSSLPWWLFGVVLVVGLAGGVVLRRRPRTDSNT